MFQPLLERHPLKQTAVFIPLRGTNSHRKVWRRAGDALGGRSRVACGRGRLRQRKVAPEQIEETIFGNARQAGGGPNPRGRYPFVAAFQNQFRLTR